MLVSCFDFFSLCFIRRKLLSIRQQFNGVCAYLYAYDIRTVEGEQGVCFVSLSLLFLSFFLLVFFYLYLYLLSNTLIILCVYRKYDVHIASIYITLYMMVSTLK